MSWLVTHYIFEVGEDYKNIPVEPGIYRIYGEGGELLYIGITKNLRIRIRDHFGGYTHTKDVYHEFKKCHITLYSGNDIDSIERTMIGSLKPKYNKDHFNYTVEVKTMEQIEKDKRKADLELVHTFRNSVLDVYRSHINDVVTANFLFEILDEYKNNPKTEEESRIYITKKIHSELSDLLNL